MPSSAFGAPQRTHDASTDLARLQQAVASLEQQLDAARADHRRVCEQLVAANQGSSDMLKLSVALCRLYESDDRDSAIAGVREIVINVIGSESFAVFTVNGGGALQPLTSMGLEGDVIAWHAAARGVVGEVARTGQRHIGTARRSAAGLPESPELVACVPLRLGRRVEGVLAIHGLLAHKPELEPFDIDILDLLSTHAMSAIGVATVRAGPAAA